MPMVYVEQVGEGKAMVYQKDRGLEQEMEPIMVSDAVFNTLFK